MFKLKKKYYSHILTLYRTMLPEGNMHFRSKFWNKCYKYVAKTFVIWCSD